MADFEPLIRRVSVTFAGGTCDARGADAQDYAQELRLKVWKNLEAGAGVGYVQKAVWNCARDLARSSRRETRARTFIEGSKRRVPGAIPMSPRGPNLDRVVAFKEAWLQTPDSDKKLIEARLEGQTFQSMAQDQCVSDWTIRVRYQRASHPLVQALTP